eukprot:Nitzschia sp. Nitz4//scaffold24_size164493//63678//65452//NITZ4_002323-RA/size164493-snap-gene-0.15-mRNA-1//-1//CDS//3329544099//1547//frame0
MALFITTVVVVLPLLFLRTVAMDLENYISRYTGTTRLQRLLLIAQTEHLEDGLRLSALDLAIQQMQQDQNVRMYQRVMSNLAAYTPVSAMQNNSSNLPTMDHAWIQQTEAANRNHRHVLQGRLSTAKSHLHKEAIRTAVLALAQFDVQTGHLRDALTSLLQAVDYSTSRVQTAQISLLILQVSLALEQDHPPATTSSSFSPEAQHLSSSKQPAPVKSDSYSTTLIRSYVRKVERTLDAPGNWTPNVCGTLHDVRVQLKMALGLNHLSQGEWTEAAQLLAPLLTAVPSNNSNTTTSSSTTSSTTGTASSSGAPTSPTSAGTSTASGASTSPLDWPGVTSAADIALYASLLTLATQPRSAIVRLSDHPEALELVPAMKDLMIHWSRANYTKCMQAFSQTSVFLPPGDLYLNPTLWSLLCSKIRERCLLEYWMPYQCLSIDQMQKSFPSIPNMEDTLVDLMDRGLLDARIDARQRVLMKQPSGLQPMSDPTAPRVMDNTYAMLVRLACIRYKLALQKPRLAGGSHRTRDRNRDDDDDDESDSDPDVPMADVQQGNPDDIL